MFFIAGNREKSSFLCYFLAKFEEKKFGEEQRRRTKRASDKINVTKKTREKSSVKLNDHFAKIGEEPTVKTNDHFANHSANITGRFCCLPANSLVRSCSRLTYLKCEGQ